MLQIIKLSLISLFFTSFLFRFEADGALRKGKAQRKVNRLSSYGVSNLEELKDQALWHFQQSEFVEAKLRLQSILALDKNYPKKEEILVYLASCEFEMGQPKIAMRSIKDFGKNHADSPLITNLVELAFEIGKGYTLGEKSEYQVLFRVSKAFAAFEFVNTHDPYSIEAAEALLSMATLNMQKRNWGEAISQLQDIHRKQPATDISARADVVLGECYLGFNKGSDYDRRNLILAERYLKGYLDHYPEGEDRAYAKSLLERAYNRMGRGELDVARYYLTARKWSSSKFVLKQILENKHYSIHYKEANALLDYISKKI